MQVNQKTEWTMEETYEKIWKKKNYHQRARRDWEENWEAKGRAKQWDLGIRGADAKRFG